MAGHVHRNVIGAECIAVVAVTVLAITLVINAVARFQPILGPVENEGERAGFNRKIFA